MPATALSASVDADFRSLSRQPPADPDIHATLSDFLTYTEHFPAHLTRALTLIQNQRTHAEQKIRSIHDDATTYSRLPSIKLDSPDPVKLRRDISYALEEAERACRMSVEEAVRLDEECRRESRKLDIVVAKLRAQPLPPSRDPTPDQQALTSPNLKRERRLSTRADDDRPEKRSRHLMDKTATKLRGRKIMVPGEVLPPPDPNAAPESMSDWTSPRPSPPLLEEPLPMPEKKAADPRPRSRTPKPPRPDRDRNADNKTPKSRGPRAPGQLGTNAHSAVAGISTSNALLALTQPPDDAPPGSKWLPWMKLTEWEMAKLRKRMKKNAIWVPSQTMVRRELKNLGRGLGGKEAARENAEKTGEAFVDEHSEPDPTKVMISGEESAQINAILGPSAYADDEDQDAELINRGMRLNEAKKLKRQRLLEEQQIQAQIAREQGGEASAEVSSNKRVSASPEAQKKRKREATPVASLLNTWTGDAPDAAAKQGPVPKKMKLSATAGGQTTHKVPLAPAGVSSSPKSMSTRNRRAATPPATKKPSITLKVGKAVSEEPPNRRAGLRRSSNASMPTTSMSSATVLVSPRQTAAPSIASTKSGRRSKRPAPGIVTNDDDDESAKVGVSKRKAAPRNKSTAGVPAQGKKDNFDTGSLATDNAADEYIDPDEARYCICGDVSWGTMIACDNEESCEKEWFHLECVKLEGMPPRRTKWYCPDCRKKLKLGQGTNGLVGPSGRTGVVGR